MFWIFQVGISILPILICLVFYEQLVQILSCLFCRYFLGIDQLVFINAGDFKWQNPNFHGYLCFGVLNDRYLRHVLKWRYLFTSLRNIMQYFRNNHKKMQCLPSIIHAVITSSEKGLGKIHFSTCLVCKISQIFTRKSV